TTLKKIQSNPYYLEELLKFNRRVRDAIRKAGQPGYRASAKEIEEYFKNRMKIYQGKDASEGISLFVKGKNLPSIWLISIKPNNFVKKYNLSVDHFSVFPEELCEIPIKVSCPPNGIVLDPFMGSGTTAVVAKKLKRNFIGIEVNPDYIKIAEKRLDEIPADLFLNF
ncbi:MAG: DNA-methyltransferase, partial [Candidatus Ratteibacteria bacterium]